MLEFINGKWYSVHDGIVYIKEGEKALPRGFLSDSEIDIVSVEIPNTVTTIESDALYNIGLRHITIPTSVTSIGSEAFRCTKLTHVDIPNSVTSIGYGAFSYTPLSSVVLPSDIQCIEDGTFHNGQLKEITIPSKIIKIKELAFANNQLKELNIPGGVQTIGVRAFAENKIETLTICDTTKVTTMTFNDWMRYAPSIRSYFHSFDGNPITTLNIRHRVKKIIPFLKKFCGFPIEHIEIQENPISKQEQQEIYKMFGNIDLKCQLLEEINQAKIESNQIANEEDTTKDSEINNLIKKIENIIEPMSDDVKKSINNMIEQLLHQYRQKIENQEPELAFNTSISLNLNPTFLNMRSSVIAKLNSIYFSLTNEQKLTNLLREIESYQRLMGQNLAIPTTIETRQDKISFIMAVAKSCQNSEIIDQLCYILENINLKISRKLEQSIMYADKKSLIITNEEDIMHIFENEINRTYHIVAKYYCIYMSLNGKGNDELSKDVKTMLSIINRLEEEDKNRFLKQFLSIKNSLTLDMCVNNDLEKLQLFIRKQIHPILESIHKIIPKPIIEQVSQEIQEMLDDSVIPEVIRRQAQEELNRILKEWKEKLLQDDENIENEKYFQNLNEDTRLQIAILKDLYGIKAQIEIYMSDKKQYEELKRSI